MPATNLSSCQKRGGRCAKRSLECRLEQENHSQKVCNANQRFQLYQGIDISTKKGSTKMPLCERTRCRKQASTVRNMRSVLKKASWGTRRIFRGIRCKNRLLWYRRDIRCAEQASLVRDASSKARRTADSTDCGQPPAAPDASSARETAPLSLFAPATPSPAPSTALGTRNGPRSEVSRHKKRDQSQRL